MVCRSPAPPPPTDAPSTPTCWCVNPGAGVDKNEIKCSDGDAMHCADDELCYATGKFNKVQSDDCSVFSGADKKAKCCALPNCVFMPNKSCLSKDHAKGQVSTGCSRVVAGKNISCNNISTMTHTFAMKKNL